MDIDNENVTQRNHMNTSRKINWERITADELEINGSMGPEKGINSYISHIPKYSCCIVRPISNTEPK